MLIGKLRRKRELESKADMFTKRTIEQGLLLQRLTQQVKLLAVSLSEKARIDMEYMSTLTGKDEQELFEELKGVIFLNPMHTSDNMDAKISHRR